MACTRSHDVNAAQGIKGAMHIRESDKGVFIRISPTGLQVSFATACYSYSFCKMLCQ